MKKQLEIFFLILILACCWGPSFLFIKISVLDIPPLSLVFGRLLLGGSMLWLIMRAQGHKLWTYRREVLHFFVMGIFACGAPFFLISMGELYITSSLAAIINSTTPIFTALLAHACIKTDRINLNKGVGIIMGFFGILVVFLPSVLGKKEIDPFGTFLVFMAATSYAVGMVYSKKHFHEIPSIVGATGQLLAASVMLGPLAFIIEKPYLLPNPPLLAWSGMLGLAILGTATAFPIFYKIGKLAGATALSTSALLFPVIGIFLGVMVLDESVGPNAYVGSAIIFSGLAIANGLLPLKILRRQS